MKKWMGILVLLLLCGMLATASASGVTLDEALALRKSGAWRN